MDQSEAAGSGGGGASCIAALTRLSLHHHLPGNTGDLTVGHRTWDPRPERWTERKPLLTLDTGQKVLLVGTTSQKQLSGSSK